jgi:hypothetical protein
MPRSSSARALLLGLLGVAAAACHGSDSGSDVPDGGFDTSDSSIHAIECDGQPVGAVEQRVRYQNTSVPADGSCMAQDQTRSCAETGDWTEWSGDYGAETCQVEGFADCDGKPHGTEETRERYELPSVAFGSMCNKQTQSRTCSDGAWSDWSGSFEADTCAVEGAASCDGQPHGTEQEQTRYEASEVPFGSECKAETQTRSCSNGSWSEWTGAFTADSCHVLGALSCGNTPHAGHETRTRFEASLVPADQTCKDEEQQRTCSNGAWGEWSGTFAAESCDVEGKRKCGDIPHGSEEHRLRYESESVPYGAECVSEQQTRTCTDGTFGEWGGTFTVTECAPEPPAACADVPHGSEETRTRYRGDEVPFGQSCESEAQQRRCDNGNWTEWSGSFTSLACHVGEPPDCEDGAHGSHQTRVRYQASVVPFGTQCAEETQTRTCSAGSWSEWSGGYAAESCVVADPRPCDDLPHGSTRTQDRYQASVVPFGSSCVSETQTSTCNDGTWSAWSGSYAAGTCVVAAPADCDGGAHGSSQQRTRWAVAAVPAGSSCHSENQTRSCYDGTWSGWTGTYSAQSCRVRGQSCTDYTTTPTTVVLDGEAQSRTRYAVAFPVDACQQETQTRQCNNGTFGSWSGSYLSEGCATRPAPSANVVSCLSLLTYTPYCTEYRGTIDLSVYQQSCSGVWDATRGCATGGTSMGKCTYDASPVRVGQSFYAPIASFDHRALCLQQGGTWTDP